MANQTDAYSISLPFNPNPSTKLHIDLNSCFASIEQQANPKLRGKPIVVASYAADYGCILAPSREAKTLGIKTGMKVLEARLIYPKLIILSPDPWKYRIIHIELRKLLLKYTDSLTPKSIDEFVLDFKHSPYFKKGVMNVALEIKERIKREIGEFLTVSVGVAANRYLAKIGAGLHKPDGLDEVNKDNFLKVYETLKLTDLYGIANRNERRLQKMGINSVLDFYYASVPKIKGAFESVLCFDWYARLRGYEVDDVEFKRRTFGNSFAMPGKFSDPKDLGPVLQKLVEKMGFRLRKAGYKASGVHVSLSFSDHSYWHHGQKTAKIIFDSREIYKLAFGILKSCPFKRPVHILAVSVFNLSSDSQTQLELFEDVTRRQKVTKALDSINERWGNFVITPAGMMNTQKYVLDRIAFGGVKELEEFTMQR